MMVCFQTQDYVLNVDCWDSQGFNKPVNQRAREWNCIFSKNHAEKMLINFQLETENEEQNA